MVDSDIQMTSAPDLATPIEERLKSRLDGMSVLLRAGEIVEQHGRYERRR